MGEADRVFRDCRKEFRRVQREREEKEISDFKKLARKALASDMTMMTGELTRENEAIAAEIPIEGDADQKRRQQEDWQGARCRQGTGL